MSTAIPDLWPKYVTVTNILSPETILRYQASSLREKTKGILEAEIVTVSENNGEKPDNPFEEGSWIVHHFELIAPLLGRYRFRLFSIRHKPDVVYPVVVDGPPSKYCHGQDEFTGAVAAVLESAHARSVIQSLLAQSNDKSPQLISASQ